MFWTIFKADLLFGVCSITLSVIVTLAITKWRRRKMKAVAAEPGSQKGKGAYAVIIGGKEPSPAHCPLCGQDWPLPGPVKDQEPKLNRE